MSTSTHLLLPYVLAAQAQKHVTVNEGLRLLDGLVQLAVLDRHLTAPPASPADGDRYIVASGATGAWAGWDLNVAYWVDGAWMRLVPRPGWQAWVVDEASFLAWNGSAWVAAGLPAFFSDAVFELAHDGDLTRRAVFDLAAIAASAVRTFSLPDVSTELAGQPACSSWGPDRLDVFKYFRSRFRHANISSAFIKIRQHNLTRHLGLRQVNAFRRGTGGRA